MTTSLPQTIDRGYAQIYPGQVMLASQTTPDIAANITYTVRAISTERGGGITLTGVKPINRPVMDDSLAEIVPAVAGDPCIVMRFTGISVMIQLTEKFAEGECPE